MEKPKLRKVVNLRIIAPTESNIVDFINRLESSFDVELYPSRIIANQGDTGFRCFVSVPLKKKGSYSIDL